MPNTVKKNTQKSMTLAIMGIAAIMVPIRTRIPGKIDMARSGLSTLITLSELTPVPIPGMALMMEMTTTAKSITFHPSFRYDVLSRMNPMAMILVTASSVNSVVKKASESSMALLLPGLP